MRPEVGCQVLLRSKKRTAIGRPIGMNSARSPRWNLLGLGVTVALCTALCGTICAAAGREPSDEEARRIEKLESEISGQVEAVEKSFSAQVERMEQALTREVEAIEKDLTSVVESLEKKPDDQTPLQRVPEIKKRIQDLALEVERLKKVTESFPRSLKKPAGQEKERRK
jgi:hypothetical protein